MFFKVTVAVFVMCAFLVSCGEGGSENQTAEVIDKESQLKSSKSSMHYCFFTAASRLDWHDATVSDGIRTLLIQINLYYEDGSLLLPPVAAEGTIWAAVGCDDENFLKLFDEKKYQLTVISYREYKAALERASRPYEYFELPAEGAQNTE